MAVDSKYGTVTTEHGDLGEDEPVVVFRAQDALLLGVLDDYYDQCRGSGCPQHHLDRIEQTRAEVEAWQATHQDQVRLPNSNNYRARVAGQ